MEIILNSIITCPHCGYSKEETMPTDACQYFYKCEKLLKFVFNKNYLLFFLDHWAMSNILPLSSCL